MEQNRATDRRVAARIDVERRVTVVVDGVARAARTVNVSTSGMLVAIEGELTIWTEIAVVLPEVGEHAARVVRRDGARYGLVLREPLSMEAFAAFTGVALVAEEPVEETVETGPVPRVAPWAFGRDKMKEFRRLAAENAVPPRRG